MLPVSVVSRFPNLLNMSRNADTVVSVVASLKVRFMVVADFVADFRNAALNESLSRRNGTSTVLWRIRKSSFESKFYVKVALISSSCSYTML